jgi:MFS family permease
VSVATLKLPFRSLAVPNYRRYFIGQIVSLSGNWMQIVAEMWLVLRLTNSSVVVGLTAALQFVPMLFAGAWGGLLADRVSKRTLLMVTQALMAIPALTLWALAGSGAARPSMVLALVFVRGAVNAVDNPARQAFVMEMVGRDRVVNAVSLNSLIVHSARIVGPAVAGGVIAAVGVAPCFLLNALSFGAMLVALSLIDPHELHTGKRARRAPGQLRSALRHVAHTPQLRVPLVAMALVGTLSFNFQVILPLVARFAFHGTAATYALLTSSMAVGAVCGALVSGARERVDAPLIAGAAALFGVFSLAAAAAPTLPLEVAALAVTGAASVTFAAGINSTLQLEAAPAMRGRVMALYSVVFLGSTPIGAPISGWLAGAAGPRSALVLAGVAAILGGLFLSVSMRQPARSELKNAANDAQAIDQPVDVLAAVVHGERRARRGRYAELAHQRLRAVMPGADADAPAAEDLPDVVRMGPVQRERDQCATVGRRKRAVDHQRRDLRRQPLERVGDERLLVRADLLDPDRADPVDGRPEPDRLGDLRGAGLELPR